jgi:hypothetical protein
MKKKGKKMSINSSKNKVDENNFGLEFEISELIISFKELINKIPSLDVYTGEENIPFSKKEAEFQKILISEFLS